MAELAENQLAGAKTGPMTSQFDERVGRELAGRALPLGMIDLVMLCLADLPLANLVSEIGAPWISPQFIVPVAVIERTVPMRLPFGRPLLEDSTALGTEDIVSEAVVLMKNHGPLGNPLQAVFALRIVSRPLVRRLCRRKLGLVGDVQISGPRSQCVRAGSIIRR